MKPARGRAGSVPVLNVEQLAGGFVATSPALPGLVVQGRTRAETMGLAQGSAWHLSYPSAGAGECCSSPAISTLALALIGTEVGIDRPLRGC